MQVGSSLRIKGTQGGFCFDAEKHLEPLVLISAGSGVTPMMSILRELVHRGLERSCTFLHGARTEADILFSQECRRLAAENAWLKYAVTLSQPGVGWSETVGRLSHEFVVTHATELLSSRFFLCGPNDFMDALRESLIAAGVPATQIHTEQFHSSSAKAMTGA
jgi:ferredoxin-NADP reductase